MTAPAARRLANWAAGLAWADVPQEQRPLTGLRVLDTLGLVLAGSSTPAADAAIAVAESHGKTMEAGALPAGGTPAAWAAFAHAVMAHCRDFDDTFPDSVVHPGSVVVPTAIAVGTETGAENEDIAVAITAGYEVAARLGSVAERRFHRRGFHATGIAGPFAAAAAAGRTMRLNGEAMANAFGLAGSMAGGLMAFLDDGSWSKWLHAGWAAHGGIVAAQLAGRGFRGPAGVLDGRHNLYDAFLSGETVDRNALTAGLGRAWRGAEAHFKYYPCAHVIQPYLEAAIDIAETEGLDTGRIVGAECRIAPWAAQIVAVPREIKIRPASEMDAIASLPYLLAVALRDRRVTLDALDRRMREESTLLDLAARIVHAEDPALGKGFDGALRLDLGDGRRIERPVSSTPPNRERVVAKFRDNARRAITEGQAEALERAVLNGSIPEFGELLKFQPSAPSALPHEP